MPKVEYSPIALEDLRHIRNYVSTDWGEATAIRILRKVTSDIYGNCSESTRKPTKTKER
jgi:plasmid stabilization system protein ParE